MASAQLNRAPFAGPGPTGVRRDPYHAYRFFLELNGLVVGGFNSVKGVESTIATEGYVEGGVNGHTRQVLKTGSQPNLVLSRGMTDSYVLWKWYSDTLGGRIQRRNIRVVLLDEQGDPAVTWSFDGAIPVKWTGPSFDAMQDTQVAIELLELSHLGFEAGGWSDGP